jgi:hypothetical protein
MTAIQKKSQKFPGFREIGVSRSLNLFEAHGERRLCEIYRDARPARDAAVAACGGLAKAGARH